jgi:hypothetical protein
VGSFGQQSFQKKSRATSSNPKKYVYAPGSHTMESLTQRQSRQVSGGKSDVSLP